MSPWYLSASSYLLLSMCFPMQVTFCRGGGMVASFMLAASFLRSPHLGAKSPNTSRALWMDVCGSFSTWVIGVPKNCTNEILEMTWLVSFWRWLRLFQKDISEKMWNGKKINWWQLLCLASFRVTPSALTPGPGFQDTACIKHQGTVYFQKANSISKATVACTQNLE